MVDSVVDTQLQHVYKFINIFNVKYFNEIAYQNSSYLSLIFHYHLVLLLHLSNFLSVSFEVLGDGTLIKYKIVESLENLEFFMNNSILVI